VNIGSTGTFTYNTAANNSSRGIKLIADGRGLTGNGDIVIEKPLNLNGANGGGDGGNGGGRKFGSGLGGNDKSTNRAGQSGSLLRDELNGVLSLSGYGAAANAYLSYTGLTVAANSALELGGADATATLSVSNSAATAVRVTGTLKIDVDGDAGSADMLSVSNALNISGATLNISEITPMRESTSHPIATYGTLAGVFAATNGLPEGATIDYADDNRILLHRPVPGMVLIAR